MNDISRKAFLKEAALATDAAIAGTGSRRFRTIWEGDDISFGELYT